MCDRHGDDYRRVALFCLSGSNEALVVEVDRNTGSSITAVGVGAHAGGVGAGVFRESVKFKVLSEGILSIDMVVCG